MNEKLVEQFINPANYSILWADLGPEYRGYQLSTNGYVRSLKFPGKFPLGTLIFPDKKNRFILSNSVNKRVSVEYSELADIANKNGFSFYTVTIPKRSSRNPIASSESDYRRKQFEYVNGNKGVPFYHPTFSDNANLLNL